MHFDSAQYRRPQGNGANLCRCNMVVWNLIQACSLCQGGRTASWGNWVSNCSTDVITIGSYPLQLAPYVATQAGLIYHDFSSQGTFQLQATREVTASESEMLTFAGTSTATGTSTAISTPCVSISNAGAIARAGGVVGLVLVAILGWFILRKKTTAKGDYQLIHD
ncbi:hypothetical protein RSAG8_13636, partial [Rhizoctonia solani AG-8 WAC10335]